MSMKLLLKHPKYINSEIFIELKSDKYLQISFSPILLDYFPIEEGNSWKYSTSYRLHEDAGMTFVNGLIEITVLATDSGIESSAYIFLARVDYLIESKQWGSEMDSSYIQKDIEFIITQHTDGTLEISDYQSDFVIGKIASTFRCTQLKRYYPAYMGENIIKLSCGWSIYTSEVLLEEEMGIKDILFNDASMGASYPGIFRLNLIDYRVNKDTVY